MGRLPYGAIGCFDDVDTVPGPFPAPAAQPQKKERLTCLGAHPLPGLFVVRPVLPANEMPSPWRTAWLAAGGDTNSNFRPEISIQISGLPWHEHDRRGRKIAVRCVICDERRQRRT